MIRNITIEAVLNGFVVQVGCQRVVFSKIEDLTNELNKYLRHPEETEAEYQKLPNAKHTLVGPEPPAYPNPTTAQGCCAITPVQENVPCADISIRPRY